MASVADDLQPIAVIGAGGHAKVLIAAAREAGLPLAAVYDDDESRRGGHFEGLEVRGPISAMLDHGIDRAVLAIGDNSARRRVHDRLAASEIAWATVVHPRAWVHGSVQLGAGTVVFAGAQIQPWTVLGAHAIVNTGATIDHDCTLGDFVHVAPGVNLAGDVELGRGVFMGIGSCAIPGTCIGAWTRVGAGAAVVSDLPAEVLAVGVPAKVRA